MKKHLIRIALLAVLTFSLAACNGAIRPSTSIGDIVVDGVDDALIDGNSYSMRLNLSYENESFDLSKIKASNSSVRFLDGNGNEISGLIRLNVGENKLKAIFTAGNTTISYDVIIVREEQKILSITDIKVVRLKKRYLVNEEFTNGLLRVSYSDGSSKDIDLTIDMVEGFTTADIGKLELKISYANKVISYNIEVVGRSYEIKELKKSYGLGDSFTPGVLSIKTGEVITEIEITEDMVQGFDTSSAGVKEIYIVYNDIRIKSQIEVFDILYEVKSLKDSYYINDSFIPGELSITIGDEVSIVPITIDMVKGFDTTAAGKKILTITYNNRSIEYEINVYNKNVKVVYFKESYLVGEEFSNGLIRVNSGNDSKDIEITLDMVSGFKTDSVGYFDVVISYEGMEFKRTIYVDSLVNITKNNIKRAMVSYLSYIKMSELKDINDLNATYLATKKEVEKTINNDDIDDVYDSVMKLNIDNKALEGLISLLDNEALMGFSFYLRLDVTTSSSFKEILDEVALNITKDDIANIEAILARLNEIFTPSQLGMMYLGIDEYGLMVNVEGEHRYVTLKELIDIVGLPMVSDTINGYLKNRPDNDDYLTVGTSIKSILDTISRLDIDKLYNLLKEIVGVDATNGSILRSLGIAIEDIYNKVDLEIIKNTLKFASSYRPADSLRSSLLVQSIDLVIDLAFNHLPDIIEDIKNLSDSEADNIVTLLEANGIHDKEIRAIVSLIASTSNLLISIKNDDELISAINKLFRPSSPECDFKVIIDNLIAFKDTALHDDLTDEEVEALLMSLSNRLNKGLGNIEVYEDYNKMPIIKLGSNSSDAIIILNEAYNIYNRLDELNYELTEDLIVDLASFKASLNATGLYSVDINIAGRVIKLYYYVYDRVDLTLNGTEIIDKLLNITVLYDINTGEPKGILNSSLEEITKDELISHISWSSFKYRIPELNLEVTIDLDITSLDFIRGNDNGFAAIRINSSYGSLVLPCRGVKIDYDNLKLTAVHVNFKDGSNEIALPSDGSGSFDIYFDFSSFMILKRINVAKQGNPSDLELSEKVLNKSFSFKLRLITPFEAEDIIKIIDGGEVYRDDINSFFNSLNQIEVYFRNNTRTTLSGNILYELLYDRYDSFTIAIAKEEKDYNTYRLSCKKDGIMLKDYTFRAKPISDDKYNSYMVFFPNEYENISLRLPTDDLNKILNGDTHLLEEYTINRLKSLSGVMVSLKNQFAVKSLGEYIINNSIGLSFDELRKYDSYYETIVLLDGVSFSFRLSFGDDSLMPNTYERVDIKGISAYKLDGSFNLSDGGFNLSDDEIYNIILKTQIVKLKINGVIKELKGQELVSFLKDNSFTIRRDYKSGFNYNVTLYNSDFNLDLSFNLELILPEAMGFTLNIENTKVEDTLEIRSNDFNWLFEKYYNSINFTGLDGKSYRLNNALINTIKLINVTDSASYALCNLTINMNGVDINLSVSIPKAEPGRGIDLFFNSITTDDINNITLDEIKASIYFSEGYNDLIGVNKAIVDDLLYDYYLYNDNHITLNYKSSGLNIGGSVNVKVYYSDINEPYKLYMNDMVVEDSDRLIAIDNSLEGFTNDFNNNLSSINIDNELIYDANSINKLYTDYEIEIIELKEGSFRVLFKKINKIYHSIIINTTNKPYEATSIDIRKNYDFEGSSYVDLDIIGLAIDSLIINSHNRGRVILDSEAIKKRIDSYEVAEDYDSFMVTIYVKGCKASLEIKKLKSFYIDSFTISYNKTSGSSAMTKELLLSLITEARINNEPITTARLKELFNSITLVNLKDGSFKLVYKLNGNELYRSI